MIYFLALALLAAPAAKKTETVVPAILVAPEPARLVQYGARDTIDLRTKPGYISLIVLPEKEKIVEVLIGDNEHWEVGPNPKSVTFNSAWVKPLKDNRETNLHLKTLAGNNYSFRLTAGPGEADFKIFVMPKDQVMQAALDAPPRFVEASQVESLKQDAEQWRMDAYKLRKEKEEAEKASVQQIAEARAQASQSAQREAHHNYRFLARTAPFNIAAVWHDGKFTYIRASPEEAPALYEIRDDKPNLIQFSFADGLYTVDKVLSDAYLQMGRQKTRILRVQ